MSFSRVLQLDGISVNSEIGKLFAKNAVNVVRGITGARFDIDPEIGALTKAALNFLYIYRFGVTPGAGLLGLIAGEREMLSSPKYLKIRVIGSVAVFLCISYLKSRQLMPRLTKVADLIVVLNFVAFLINGIYPTFGERFFDLRQYSQSGPGDTNAMNSGHHRELLFHLMMEILDNVNRVDLSFITPKAPRRWLSLFLNKWFSKVSEDEGEESAFLCVLCKQTPVNTVRGGISVLNQAKLAHQSSSQPDDFCDCFYCHTCFATQIASDLSTSWDSKFCSRCAKRFPMPRTTYL